jgi:hypothetical protein
MGLGELENEPPELNEVLMTNYSRMPIFHYNEAEEMVHEASPGLYVPKWQSNPVLRKDPVNQNILSHALHGSFVQRCLDTGHAVLGNFENAPAGSIRHPNKTTALLATLRSFVEKEEVEYLGALFSMLYLPIFDTFGPNRQVVAVLQAIVHWRAFLRKILPDNVQGVTVVLENSCDGFYTYEINGRDAAVLGFGDSHDPKYDHYERVVFFDVEQTIVDGTENGLPIDLSACVYSLHVYPSQVSRPIIIAKN